MDIYFHPDVELRCPQCDQKSVSITEHTILCWRCEWSRDRRYPVPPRTPVIPDWMSLGPFTVDTVRQAADWMRKAGR